MKKAFILIIVFLFGTIFSKGSCDLGKKLESPDKRFKVSIIGTPNKYKLFIEDTRNYNNDLEDILELPIELKWAVDSKTILVVQHLAGGSFVSAIHYSNDHWNETDIEPPTQTPSIFSVQKIESEKTGIIHIEYLVTPDEGHGQRGATELVKFDFNSLNGNTSNIKIK